MGPIRQHVNAFCVSGLTVRTTNREESAPATARLGALWGRFFGEEIHASAPNLEAHPCRAQLPQRFRGLRRTGQDRDPHRSCMSRKKSWRERLASHPHLPTFKDSLAAMRPWRGEESSVGGELNPKYPGGIEAQMWELEAEGHTVVQRVKRYFVEDFAKKLTGPR